MSPPSCPNPPNNTSPVSRRPRRPAAVFLASNGAVDSDSVARSRPLAPPQNHSQYAHQCNQTIPTEYDHIHSSQTLEQQHMQAANVFSYDVASFTSRRITTTARLPSIVPADPVDSSRTENTQTGVAHDGSKLHSAGDSSTLRPATTRQEYARPLLRETVRSQAHPSTAVRLADISEPSANRQPADSAAAEPAVQPWSVDPYRPRSLPSLRRQGERRLDAEELNNALRPEHLDKLRYALRPDEAFGAIFSWDVVFPNSRALELKAWQTVAEEAGLTPPDMDDILRAEAMAPEAAIHRVFFWTSDWGEIKKLLFRKCEVYDILQQTWPFALPSGLHSWLSTLDRYGVRSVLLARRPRSKVEAIIERAGLGAIFSKSQLVTSDDDCDTLEHMLLVAATKLDRPPSKCVMFTDNPDGITVAKETSARVVALIGAHPAYEVKSADKIIANFDDLVVYHVRSLFGQQGVEFMDPETELERATI